MRPSLLDPLFAPVTTLDGVGPKVAGLIANVVRMDTGGREARVGDLLFLSGIGPRDAATDAIPGNEYDADGRLTAYDITAQAHAVFANVRAVLEAVGVHDVLTKSQGSATAINVVQATMEALSQLRWVEEVAKDRGKPVAEVMPFWRRRSA